MTRLNVRRSGICLVSLSNNSDHQNTLYSMFGALRKKGYLVYAIGAEDPVAFNAPCTSDNFFVKCPRRPGIAADTFDFKALRALVSVIRSTGCQTVYFESVHLWNCVVMAMLGKTIVKITTLHDVVPHDGSKSVLLCQKLQSGLSDLVVIKSPQFREDAKRLYGLRDEQIVDFGVWRAWPEIAPTGGDGSFLFFGRLRKYKGVSNMLALAHACPECRFRVVGEPDEESVPLVDELDCLPNVDVVARAVSDEEMAAAFERSSWVLVPYESASQSGVIIDAYRYGRPVVAFNVGAIGKQVRDGETGLLAPAGDIDSFVACLKWAAALDSRDYSVISRGAFEFGRVTYSADTLCDSFAKTFNVKKKEGQ